MVVKDFKKIATHYSQNDLAWHLVPLIQFNWMFHFKESHLLFALKVIRIIWAYEVFDVKKTMRLIKSLN